MRQLGYGKLCMIKEVDHICCSVQTADSISRVVIAVMKNAAIALERPKQSGSRTATVINPTGEGFQVLQLLRGIFHHQDTCNATGSLRVKGIHINSVALRSGIHLVGYRIPTQCLFGFRQLSGFPKYVFHQEISQV